MNSNKKKIREKTKTSHSTLNKITHTVINDN